MSSISGDNAYHARLRKRIKEYQDILAATNPPTMILDSPTRRGHIVHGTNSYSSEPIEGGKSRHGLEKALHTIGKFVKPLNRNLKPVKRALMDRAVFEIGKPMYSPEPMQAGRSHTQKKKGFAKFVRTVGEFVKPVAQPLLQAATRRGVQAIETYGAGSRGDWMSEIRAAQAEHGCTWKQAMTIASAARFDRTGVETKSRAPRTAEQKAATKANRAAKKAKALFAELPTGRGRRM